MILYRPCAIFINFHKWMCQETQACDVSNGADGRISRAIVTDSWQFLPQLIHVFPKFYHFKSKLMYSCEDISPKYVIFSKIMALKQPLKKFLPPISRGHAAGSSTYKGCFTAKSFVLLVYNTL